MVFHTFLVQKTGSVDSFTKMDAKWPRARFGLGRAGWAGPGWLGWAGWLAGLAGWAAWAGWLGCLGWLAGLAGLGWAGPGLCLGLVLSTSGPESHQIKLPGSGFPDFWSQRQKVFKSSFLGFVLSASGANA